MKRSRVQGESGGLTAFYRVVVSAVSAWEIGTKHRDPFDRVLSAQARLTASVLVTADRAFSAVPSLRVLW